jgi:hypothetical protein
VRSEVQTLLVALQAGSPRGPRHLAHNQAIDGSNPPPATVPCKPLACCSRLCSNSDPRKPTRVSLQGRLENGWSQGRVSAPVFLASVAQRQQALALGARKCEFESHLTHDGGVAEWPMAAVLKTVGLTTPGVRIPSPPQQVPSSSGQDTGLSRR